MFSEVVKVDGKGRITIPAALRLLLDINDGEKLVLVYDENSDKIEIHLSRRGSSIFCSDIVSRGALLELLEKFRVNAISCRCRDHQCAFYHCKIIISIDEKEGIFSKALPNIKCIE